MANRNRMSIPEIATAPRHEHDQVIEPNMLRNRRGENAQTGAMCDVRVTT